MGIGPLPLLIIGKGTYTTVVGPSLRTFEVLNGKVGRRDPVIKVTGNLWWESW